MLRYGAQGGSFILLFALLSCGKAVGAAKSDDLFALSLDELMQLEVTSVSRRPEEMRHAPSAIYVITAEDLRRSGATTIAESLRLVPGMNVRRLGSSNWAISARDFDRLYANKLLVMTDGRTVYSPNFSGVFWDAQDTIMEDIERIEVIRGPGAVMWGANAVNGVVNIVTRSAHDTQGTLISATAGTEDQGILSARYGFSTSNGGAARTWVKATARDDQVTVQPNQGDDDWQTLRSGFRYDSDANATDTFTIQADVHSGRKETYSTLPTLTPPNYQSVYNEDDVRNHGANILGRWHHSTANDGELIMQVYYDNDQRLAKDFYSSILQTSDFEFQHIPQITGRHSFIWGGGVRYVDDNLKPEPLFPNAEQAYYTRTSGFFQYGYALIEDKLNVSLGSKFEYNDFTYFEPQPSVRLLWYPNQSRTFWWAVSRAVRTAGRNDQSADLNYLTLPPAAPADPPTLVTFKGNDDYQSENLTAFEWGWRERFSANLTSDLATFYNRYDDERAVIALPPITQPGPPQYVEQAITPVNENTVHTWGFEYLVDWQPRKNWQVQAWYSFIRRVDEYTENPDVVFALPGERREEDRDSASLRSYWNQGSFEIDSRVRYVDGLISGDVDPYTELDVRFGWRVHPEVRLSLYLSNLLDDSHLEGRATDTISFADTEVERAASVTLEWRPAAR